MKTTQEKTEILSKIKPNVKPYFLHFIGCSNSIYRVYAKNTKEAKKIFVSEFGGNIDSVVNKRKYNGILVDTLI